MGDGILAYFPENMQDNCIITSVKIHEAINESSLLPVGIGCDFGEVIIGDIGEETRLDYTLIGSPVNFASRMCDNAKGGTIAISNRVYERLDSNLKENILVLPSFEKIKVQMKKSDPETEGIKFNSSEFKRNTVNKKNKK
ncbi:adenylate/guanylate cyclase domain-containing protein [Candidatus Desantisbacteria bacterium]|nr:adenylate/guanylate cyclase domain-containing protein [Candidatus Desantisbacteria bacterium]